MTGRICARIDPRTGAADCLAAFAAGDINATDLCGTCTASFMAALDEATGRRLPWHRSYVERARDRAES